MGWAATVLLFKRRIYVSVNNNNPIYILNNNYYYLHTLFNTMFFITLKLNLKQRYGLEPSISLLENVFLLPMLGA
jgi:hypothetical protein